LAAINRVVQNSFINEIQSGLDHGTLVIDRNVHNSSRTRDQKIETLDPLVALVVSHWTPSQRNSATVLPQKRMPIVPAAV
jgi:hypothetical protein